MIALSFGGICTFFGKNKKSAIIKGTAGFVFAAVMVFAVAPLVNNIFFGNTGNEFSVTLALSIIVAASVVVFVCYYRKIAKKFNKFLCVVLAVITALSGTVGLVLSKYGLLFEAFLSTIKMQAQTFCV